MTMALLIDYKIATSPTLPPIARCMMEYWVAGNGVFVRAARQGISACIPISQCTIRGLPNLSPYFHLSHPPVPANLVLTMLQASQAVGHLELLFLLCFADGEWHLHIPEQIATPTSVTPVETSSPSYDTAIIEVHSHHAMSAQFSATDDREESGKFRIFAVLGTIFTRPTICVRVGIYSHLWEIPANWVFELPSELSYSNKLCN